MRKFIVVLIVLLLIPMSALWARGGKEADGPIVFGNIPVAMSDEWNGYSVENFLYAAEKMGVEVVTLDSEWDGERALNNLEEVHKACILAALELKKGNRAHATKLLGISKRTLFNWIKRIREDGIEVLEGKVGHQ